MHYLLQSDDLFVFQQSQSISSMNAMLLFIVIFRCLCYSIDRLPRLMRWILLISAMYCSFYHCWPNQWSNSLKMFQHCLWKNDASIITLCALSFYRLCIVNKLTFILLDSAEFLFRYADVCQTCPKVQQKSPIVYQRGSMSRILLQLQSSSLFFLNRVVNRFVKF